MAGARNLNQLPMCGDGPSAGSLLRSDRWQRRQRLLLLVAMTEAATPRSAIHAELDRARTEFRQLVATTGPVELARGSNGTRWTNQQMLFHMLFGYLITRNLRVIVKLVSRLPTPVQLGFAGLLNAGARPFDVINYWGSRAGSLVVPATRLPGWLDAVTSSLDRHLDAETDAALARSMAFPARWDPFFAPRMTLLDVYHYATQHFDWHRQQLTISDPRAPTQT